MMHYFSLDMLPSFPPKTTNDAHIMTHKYFQSEFNSRLSNSYTMGCPPVRGDNARALASGYSYVQVDKHDITISYHQHQCRPCKSRDISR